MARVDTLITSLKGAEGPGEHAPSYIPQRLGVDSESQPVRVRDAASTTSAGNRAFSLLQVDPPIAFTSSYVNGFPPPPTASAALPGAHTLPVMYGKELLTHLLTDGLGTVDI